MRIFLTIILPNQNQNDRLTTTTTTKKSIFAEESISLIHGHGFLYAQDWT